MTPCDSHIRLPKPRESDYVKTNRILLALFRKIHCSVFIGVFFLSSGVLR